MAVQKIKPGITLENALLGLSLTEALFDPTNHSHQIIDQITAEHDESELLSIYAQFASLWAMAEAERCGLSVSDYIALLRMELIHRAG